MCLQLNLGPTRWKVRTNICKLSSGLHKCAMTHMHLSYIKITMQFKNFMEAKVQLSHRALVFHVGFWAHSRETLRHHTSETQCHLSFHKTLILPLYLSALGDFQRPIHLLFHVLRYDLTLLPWGCGVRLSWNTNPCVTTGPSQRLSRLCFTHLWNKHKIVPIVFCETCGKLLKWLRIGPTLNSSKHLKSCSLKELSEMRLQIVQK